MERDRNQVAFYARVGLILHAFIVTMLILYLGKILFIPLFFALLVAILLYPLTRMLEKRMNKVLAAVLPVVLFIAFIGSIVFFFIKELILYLKDLPKAQGRFVELAQNIQHWISDKFNIDDAHQMDYIKKSANDISSRLLSSAGNTFVGTVEGIVLFFFFLIFTYFILVHRRLLKNFVLAFFHAGNKSKIQSVIDHTRAVINSYVLGLLTEMAILFTLILIILLLLGVKYALLIAVIAAILNIIPYIGIYIAALFGMFIAFTNGSGAIAMYTGISFIAVHFVDANILMPHIVGGRVKINPFITIVAVILGRLIWGVPGMFLFIPLMAIIRVISDNVDDLRPWSILIGEEK